MSLIASVTNTFLAAGLLVQILASVISNICFENPSANEVFGTDAMRDMLIKWGNSAKTVQERASVASVISNICFENPSANEVFGTDATRDMLI
eukprot:COSAG01_NODE_53648_length_337_cov_1.634454_1_plen_92_part_01